MKRVFCNAGLITLALALAASVERFGNGDEPNRSPTANGQAIAPKEITQEPLDTLKALGASTKLDDKGNVIVVQIRDGKATDATAKLLVAMKGLKDLQLSGEKVTDAAIDHITGLDKL